MKIHTLGGPLAEPLKAYDNFRSRYAAQNRSQMFNRYGRKFDQCKQH